MPLSLFDHELTRDPSALLEEFVRAAPARWVVCLLADREGRPVQLLCVKNLRACLKRRLSPPEVPGANKRINYHELVAQVHWAAVDSAFEADWMYLEAARKLFPGVYRRLVGFRPAWFVSVDPDAQFPRFTRHDDLPPPRGVTIGPLEDRKSADRLIAQVEDLFDLCRYYSILVQAPAGRACAYKEMGRCPAPCDGSISMERYRDTIRASVATVLDPAPFIEQQQQAMRQAAAELRFELAARIKGRIESAAHLNQGSFRHLRRVADFRFLSIQRGPKPGTAKVFLISPGQIEMVGGLLGDGAVAGLADPGVLVGHASSLSQPEGQAGCLSYGPSGLTEAGYSAEQIERIGLVAHHLFYGKPAEGAFIPLDLADNTAIQKAFREIQKQKPVEPAEDEGVVREMGA